MNPQSLLSSVSIHAALGLISQAGARGFLGADHAERLFSIARGAWDCGLSELFPAEAMKRIRDAIGEGRRREALRSLRVLEPALREASQKGEESRSEDAAIPEAILKPYVRLESEIAGSKTPSDLIAALRRSSIPGSSISAEWVEEYFAGRAALEGVTMALGLYDRAWEIARDRMPLEGDDVPCIRQAGFHLSDIVERPWRNAYVPPVLRRIFEDLFENRLTKRGKEGPGQERLERLRTWLGTWGPYEGAGGSLEQAQIYFLLNPGEELKFSFQDEIGGIAVYYDTNGAEGPSLGILDFHAKNQVEAYRAALQTYRQNPRIFRDETFPFALPLTDPEGLPLQGLSIGQNPGGVTSFSQLRGDLLQAGLRVAEVLVRSQEGLSWDELYRLFAHLMNKAQIDPEQPAFHRGGLETFTGIPAVSVLAAARAFRKKYPTLDEEEWDGVVAALAQEAAPRFHEDPEGAIQGAMEGLLRSLEERRSRPKAARLLRLLRL